MNTPAHAVVNLLVLGRRERPRLLLPLTVGALLPDAPMLLFYAYYKAVGAAENFIWSTAYYDPGWQAFIDIFNSLPLIGLGLLLAHRAAMPRLAALFSSVALHALCDLPLHREDAHRHFFPLSDWRFESPVSYWDPRHGGAVFSLVESIFVVAGCAVLARRGPCCRLSVQ